MGIVISFTTFITFVAIFALIIWVQRIYYKRELRVQKAVYDDLFKACVASEAAAAKEPFSEKPLSSKEYEARKEKL